MNGRFPLCSQCGIEIDPAKYEDCRRYFFWRGEVLCQDCFRSSVEEYAETNLPDLARQLGAEILEA